MKNNFKFPGIIGKRAVIITKLIIFVFAIYILCYCNGNGSPKIDIVSVKKIHDLADVKPSLNLEQTFLSMWYAVNFWEIDDKGNYYFLDIYNHRVLKFGENWQFLMQFGVIGQEEDSLYYPNGIFLYKDTLFVLDQEGKKVKSFSLDGTFLDAFDIKDAFASESIFIANDEILLSVKYRFMEGYNENGLVSVFSLTGQKLREFGKVVKSVKYSGYLMFNRVRIFQQGKRVFIPHKYLPVVRIFEGKQEVKTINMLDINLEEINEIYEYGKRMKVDTPDSVKKELESRAITYCSGFYPISQKEFYYVANYYRHKKSVVFILDENGTCKKRMNFEFNGKPLKIKDIKCKNSNKYCIAKMGQKIYLFKF